MTLRSVITFDIFIIIIIIITIKTIWPEHTSLALLVQSPHLSSCPISTAFQSLNEYILKSPYKVLSTTNHLLIPL